MIRGNRYSEERVHKQSDVDKVARGGFFVQKFDITSQFYAVQNEEFLITSSCEWRSDLLWISFCSSVEFGSGVTRSVGCMHESVRAFTKAVQAILREEDYFELQDQLIDTPDAGDVIPAAKEIHKVINEQTTEQKAKLKKAVAKLRTFYE